MPQRAPAKRPAPPTVLTQLNAGLNLYTDPTQTNHRMWASASNVFSGMFGFVQRARFANILITATGKAFTTIKFFALPGLSNYLLGDINNQLFSFDSGTSYGSIQRFNPYVDPSGVGVASLAGPWSREVLQNIVYEMNGTIKQAGRLANAATIEGFGLDSPDVAPSVTLSAGVITKSIGRSYAFAWENNNKSHVGAISPATAFIAYAAQQGTIQTIEAGTVTINGGTVTGTGTSFTSAWVGRSIWIQNLNGGTGTTFAQMRILSVQSATQLTVVNSGFLQTGSNPFTIVDPQATHIRLYATADGGATYFRIQRNAVTFTSSNLVTAGFQFTDNDNSEPPNGEFTSETAQLFNIPPPVGAFLKEYQGRLLVYGGTIPGQTFFYTNSEATSVGLGQESSAPLNQITLPIQNANINGMVEFPGSLVIWSDKQDMFRLTGLLTDNVPSASSSTSTAFQQGTQIAALPYNLGCASPFAVALTPLGAIWLTSNAEVWLFTDKYAPKNIGHAIQGILRTITPANLKLARMAYYHNYNRNWVLLSVAANSASSNNMVLILDLDLLSAQGSPSFFVFDMATNQPTWYKFDTGAPALEVMFEAGGIVRAFVGATDLVRDIDFQAGVGTEQTVLGTILLHAWGNDTPFIIKRPSWVRFNTSDDPSLLAENGWAFSVNGIDDDFYTFAAPLTLQLVPGFNDSSTLGGNPLLTSGSAFRHSPELFKIGGVNFVAGRRLQFGVTFPNAVGTYQLRAIQLEAGIKAPM